MLKYYHFVFDSLQLFEKSPAVLGLCRDIGVDGEANYPAKAKEKTCKEGCKIRSTHVQSKLGDDDVSVGSNSCPSTTQTTPRSKYFTFLMSILIWSCFHTVHMQPLAE